MVPLKTCEFLHPPLEFHWHQLEGIWNQALKQANISGNDQPLVPNVEDEGSIS